MEDTEGGVERLEDWEKREERRGIKEQYAGESLKTRDFWRVLGVLWVITGMTGRRWH